MSEKILKWDKSSKLFVSLTIQRVSSTNKISFAVELKIQYKAQSKKSFASRSKLTMAAPEIESFISLERKQTFFKLKILKNAKNHKKSFFLLSDDVASGVAC